MGYSMDDILFMAVSTDDQVIDAIAGSDTSEIEQMYIFSHGWGREEREAPGGGLQLSSGDVGTNQFTSEDLEGLNLQDRFALDAEMNIKACNVGRSPLAQQIADTFGITVYASSKPMQFWKAQYWDDGFVDVLPGDLNSHGFAIEVPYNGDGKTYSGTAHVVMCPYLLGRIEKPLTVNLTIPWPFAYRPYEPQ